MGYRTSLLLVGNWGGGRKAAGGSFACILEVQKELMALDVNPSQVTALNFFPFPSVIDKDSEILQMTWIQTSQKQISCVLEDK